MPLQAARVSLACEIGEGNLSLTYSSLPEKLAEKKSSEHPLCQVKTPPELRFHPFFVCLGEWNKWVGSIKLNTIEFTISLGPDAKKEATPFILPNPCAKWKKQRRLRASLVQIVGLL